MSYEKILNPKYFQLVSSSTIDGFDYRVYRTLGNPMVLFSEVTGEPIASLHFEAQDSFAQTGESKGRALITNRPDKSTADIQMFQGLIDRDGQEFQLVITNLASTGYINFNILRTDSKVETVDPGGVNQVNELRPGESYIIKSDQNADNASLVLNAIVSESTGKKVTVKDDEASDTGPKGTYFFLSVVSQQGVIELEKKFEKTRWSTTDFIVKKSQVVLVNHVPHPNLRYRGGPMNRMARAYQVGGFGDVDIEEEADAEPIGTIMPQPTRFLGVRTVGFNPRNASMDFHGDIPKPNGIVDLLKVAESEEDDGIRLDVARPFAKESKLKTEKQSVVSDALTQEQVLNSKATQLGRGKKVVVNSSFTGIEYNYHITASRCLLGLSVADNLNFADLATVLTEEEIKGEANEMLKVLIEGRFIEFLEKGKIYESKECVVCMDEMVDCVLYTCGHKCVQYECAERLKQCPLCRKFIAAKIKTTPTYGDDYDGVKVVTVGRPVEAVSTA